MAESKGFLSPPRRHKLRLIAPAPCNPLFTRALIRSAAPPFPKKSFWTFRGPRYHARCDSANTPPECLAFTSFRLPSRSNPFVGLLKKKTEPPDSDSVSSWRRARDSNPRNVYGVHTISNRAPSTSSDNSPNRSKFYQLDANVL